MTKNSSFDILGLRDETREEIMEYLALHSYRRQEIIGDLVGLRRESICAYAQKRGALTNVSALQRLYEWMITDRKNGQELDDEQIQSLIALARKNLKKATAEKNEKSIAKWTRKLKKYQEL